MEGRLTGPLAGVLERGRERYNALFAAARRGKRSLDPEAFSEHLAACLDPIVRAIHEADAARTDPAADDLYLLSLELMGSGLLGPASRSPWISACWEELLPRIGNLLSKNPRGLAAALSNAVHNIAGEAGTKPGEWLDAMAALAPRCTGEAAFLQAGTVAAWRCGMAHFREAALSAIPAMHPSALGIALGMEEGAPDPALLAEALRDPWCPPRPAGRKTPASLAIVARVGGFRGFGGPFLKPPRAFLGGGRLHLTDGEGSWKVHADCFNALLTRSSILKADSGGARAGNEAVSPAGRVTLGARSATLPHLAGRESAATDGHTLLVTVPRSHYAYIVAAVPGEPS